MEDILLEYTKEYNFPIVNNIIPIGANVKIEKDKIKIDDKFLK